jgi:hypothetical protein
MALLPPGATTLLILDSMGVPLYSARGLTQTLAPIAQAKQERRTINGGLVDLSLAQFRKYASTITCKDQRAPAIDGIWPGQTVTVSCVAELSYLTSGGSAHRTVVSGSSYVEGAFTFYRPQLVMKVTGLRTGMDEYGAAVDWSLELEEI